MESHLKLMLRLCSMRQGGVSIAAVPGFVVLLGIAFAAIVLVVVGLMTFALARTTTVLPL